MSPARRFTRTLTGAVVIAALAAPAATARPIDEGFDVGSAAIGAGGAAAVLLLTAAGAAAVSQRRHPVRLAR